MAETFEGPDPLAAFDIVEGGSPNDTSSVIVQCGVLSPGVNLDGSPLLAYEGNCAARVETGCPANSSIFQGTDEYTPTILSTVFTVDNERPAECDDMLEYKLTFARAFRYALLNARPLPDVAVCATPRMVPVRAAKGGSSDLCCSWTRYAGHWCAHAQASSPSPPTHAVENGDHARARAQLC